MKQFSLNEDYRHFNTLIWQTPTLGFAIAAGLLGVTVNVSDRSVTFRATVLLAAFFGIGFIFLFALAAALMRYRHFQATFGPRDFLSPPFGMRPKANRLLQLSMCVNCGIIGGFAVCYSWASLLLCCDENCDGAQLLGWAGWFISAGGVLSTFAWWRIEQNDAIVQKKIDHWQRSGDDTGNDLTS